MLHENVLCLVLMHNKLLTIMLCTIQALDDYALCTKEIYNQINGEFQD